MTELVRAEMIIIIQITIIILIIIIIIIIIIVIIIILIIITLTEGLTNVCQQADRTQTVLDLNILKHNIYASASVNHIFELFDCLLKPILMYGCEIYGAFTYGLIASFHFKFMKHILDR